MIIHWIVLRDCTVPLVTWCNRNPPYAASEHFHLWLSGIYLFQFVTTSQSAPSHPSTGHIKVGNGEHKRKINSKFLKGRICQRDW